MRVLQINSVCGVGSTGKIAVGIHNLLKSKGHGSCIAYGRGVPRNCDSTIKIGNRIDNYIHVALTRLFDRHGFGSKRATRKFIKKIKQYNPDIIHLHNIHGYYLNVKILFDFLKSTNIPTVWTLHDCWSFTGHCSHFDFIGCDKWTMLCNKCPEKKSYPKSMLCDNSGKNFLDKKTIFTGLNNFTLVSPSYWLTTLVKRSFLKHYPVQVINNGVDIDIFKPTESDFRDRYNLGDKYVILGVASVWSDRKGLRYFIDLSDEISEDEVIVIVGLTNKQIKQIPKKIIGITKTNNAKELAEIYTCADVYINPTLEDTFPTTNIEALSCGTPVVTFNTGGSPESICSSNGIILNSDADSSKILESARDIYMSKSLMKNSISEDAKEKYDSDKNFMKYIELYDMLVL